MRRPLRSAPSTAVIVTLILSGVTAKRAEAQAVAEDPARVMFGISAAAFSLPALGIVARLRILAMGPLGLQLNGWSLLGASTAVGADAGAMILTSSSDGPRFYLSAGPSIAYGADNTVSGLHVAGGITRMSAAGLGFDGGIHWRHYPEDEAFSLELGLLFAP